MNSLASLKRWIGRRLRYYTLPREQRMNMMYDEQTVQVMSRVLRHDSTAVDIGCHKGSVLRDIIRLAPDGKHYAFEPIPHLADALRNKFPQVKVHQLALSDSQGTSTFQYVHDFPGRSGLRRRTYPRADVRIEEISVQTDRIDNIMSRDRKIDFIKIDVEGAELQVLSGAVDTCRRNRPVIIFEHGKGAADHYGTTPAMIY